jgi:hypothetical protein
MLPEIKRNAVICQAIEDRNVLRFFYDGGVRTVEPFCHGISTAGKSVLRGFQSGGYSASKRVGWKMFEVADISRMGVLEEDFDGRRPHYNPNDPAMTKIFARVPKQP